VLILAIKFEEEGMHIDEGKKFDKRNIPKNLKNGIIAQKDYEIYLSKLPDVSDKLFNPEETPAELDELESIKDSEILPKKRGLKKKAKGKGK
jgi:hypothetical protein